MEGQESSKASHPPIPPGLTITFVFVLAATLMGSLDNTIANVALPFMQGSLSASRDQVTWVLTSYIVAAAIFTAPTAWLSARVGRKQLFLAGLAGFTVASVFCGASQSLEQIVFFRFVQGICSAPILPLGQSIVLDYYEGDKRTRMMSYWGMAVMLGTILGPTVGGYITDALTWRWIFYVNVPLGIAAFLGILIFFRDRPESQRVHFDLFGFASFGIAVGMLQIILDRGASQGWFDSEEIIIEAAIGSFFFYLFIVHFFLDKHCFVTPSLFRDLNFNLGAILTFVCFMIMIGSTTLLPPYLLNLSGYSVLQTGILISPRGLGNMAALFITSRLASRMDPRVSMIVAGTCLSWSLWNQSLWTPDISFWPMAINNAVQGFAIGFFYIQCNLLGFSTLPVHLRYEGSSLYNLLRSVGGSVSISITTTLILSTIQVEHSIFSEAANSFNRAFDSGSAGLFYNLTLPAGAEQLNSVINREGAIIGYSNAYRLLFYLSLALPLCAFAMRGPRPGKAPMPIPVSD